MLFSFTLKYFLLMSEILGSFFMVMTHAADLIQIDSLAGGLKNVISDISAVNI